MPTPIPPSHPPIPHPSHPPTHTPSHHRGTTTAADSASPPTPFWGAAQGRAPFYLWGGGAMRNLPRWLCNDGGVGYGWVGWVGYGRVGWGVWVVGRLGRLAGWQAWQAWQAGTSGKPGIGPASVRHRSRPFQSCWAHFGVTLGSLSHHNSCFQAFKQIIL